MFVGNSELFRKVVEKALQTSVVTQWVGLGVDGSPVFSKMCSVVFLLKEIKTSFLFVQSIILQSKNVGVFNVINCPFTFWRTFWKEAGRASECTQNNQCV